MQCLCILLCGELSGIPRRAISCCLSTLLYLVVILIFFFVSFIKLIVLIVEMLRLLALLTSFAFRVLD